MRVFERSMMRCLKSSKLRQPELPASTIVVTPASPSIAINATVQLTATLRDASGNVLTGRTVTWETSAAGTATAIALSGAVFLPGKTFNLTGNVGFYRGKARKLKAFISLLDERFGGDLQRLLSTSGDELRTALLSTHGVGPETADSILLYAAHQPYFVIDAYTRRILHRHVGLCRCVDRGLSKGHPSQQCAHAHPARPER